MANFRYREFLRRKLLGNVVPAECSRPTSPTFLYTFRIAACTKPATVTRLLTEHAASVACGAWRIGPGQAGSGRTRPGPLDRILLFQSCLYTLD